MTVFNIIGFVSVTFLIIIALIATFSIIQYLYTFHHHKCKHCGQIMEFRGLKENDKESHFLFHCEQCGAWEQIPKEEMYRNYNYDKKETTAT